MPDLFPAGYPDSDEEDESDSTSSGSQSGEDGDDEEGWEDGMEDDLEDPAHGGSSARWVRGVAEIPPPLHFLFGKNTATMFFGSTAGFDVPCLCRSPLKAVY
jgi:hypothetical protein